ncbi:ABC transporter substrate-binding protein [Gorillibacterium massiliense]|uniref:ABC transporter substrate-binding protein n=1 Tax=Gorillibacterium massiliense TaxID=1280390 RepID=UPI0004BB1B52|nr:sugar ABC transporter substrate-binding protein [Gorillibacterium massiliense]
MKVKMKRVVSMLLVSMMAAGLLAGCGGGSKSEGDGNGNASTGTKEKKVELEFWTISLQPTFNDYFKKLITEFEGQHPNVKIDWKDYPYDAIQNKLLTSIASDQAPDVINLNTEMANQMGTKNAMVDLNAELTNEQKALYFPGLYDSTVINGKAYALPWYTGLPVLFMNKELIEKAGLDINNPPKTNEEYNAWAKQIKEKTGKAGYTIKADAELFVAEGEKLLTDDNSAPAFNTPGTEKILADYVQMIKDGYIPKEDAIYTKQIQYFASEQVAMTVSTSSFINQLKTSSQDVYAKTVAAPAPVGKGNVRFSQTMNIGVPAATKNKAEAIEFALFVTNAANQLQFSKEANTLPSTVDSIKDPFFTEDDGTLEAKAKVASAQSLDKARDFLLGVQNANDIRDAVAKRLQSVILNYSDIAKELKAAEKDVKTIMSR